LKQGPPTGNAVRKKKLNGINSSRKRPWELGGNRRRGLTFAGGCFPGGDEARVRGQEKRKTRALVRGKSFAVSEEVGWNRRHREGKTEGGTWPSRVTKGVSAPMGETGGTEGSEGRCLSVGRRVGKRRSSRIKNPEP